MSQLISSLPSPLSRPAADPDITSITDDSRRVAPGALFVAYPGVAVDGHRFIPDAIARGAAAIVGEQSPISTLRSPYLQVRNGREAFAQLHAAWNGFPARRLILIGVTGTDGKTTTTNLIYSILTAAGSKAGMISTVNAVIGAEVLDTGLHVTTPDADEVQRYLRRMVEAGLTHCVLEVTSHGLAQHRVDGCEFDVAVVTNVTHEHLDLHGSLEAYRAAKARLFEALATAYDKGVPKTAVLNLDDSSYGFLRERVRGRVYAYSVAESHRRDAEHNSENSARSARLWRQRLNHPNMYATDIVYAPDATRFTAVVNGNAVPIETALVGEFNVSNCLAAIAATVGALGVDPDAARRGIAALKGVPGRMERIDEGQDFFAIVDFAHTPNALDQAIAAARTMTTGQVIVVFGSAGLRDREKRRLMGENAGRAADKIVITAEDPRTEPLDAIIEATARAVAAQGRREGVDFWRVPDRGEALAFACALARPGDVVLACGKGHEQSMCFGEIEYPWDDRVALRAALKGAPLQTLPTARKT
ncbi:MAG TPA: UDP-N-acetylmuramoyl-L-alanyl-D-glutamate--2,6-diaminopimelate ligase [Anaerolineae bacterium]|nr:UDP-N-acetylmuramoyl-L-alanyl-D-glutamate--2,6-diaminopimelate ligase [Anaerolineae bacterium]